jgi:LysM repeat protein
MTRQALGGFIAINIVVSIVVAILIIFVWSETNEDKPIVVTRIVRDTNDVNNDGGDGTVAGAIPNAAYEQTITSLNAERTAQAREIATLENFAATQGFVIETEVPRTEAPVDTGGVPTLPSDILDSITLPPGSGGASSSGGPVTPTPNDGCVRYFVEQGDTCGSIAGNFNVDVDDLINLNGIDAACLTLRLDQEIKIPGPSCQSPPTVTATPTITRTPFVFGTFSVTNTPVATSTSADVEIVQVLQAGDVTAEQVEIRNTGVDVVEMDEWTLEDADGNVFTFPDLRMQPNQVIRVFSRVGQNTPAALYWNQTVAVWASGEIVTLSDGSGAPQSVLAVGETQTIDFDDEG